MTSNHLLLYRLAELMLEHEQHFLPVDVLFDDEQIGDFVKSIQIDSPYQQMLLEGVLTESVRHEQLYVSFTIEGYFHFVLGEVIHSVISKKGINFLKEQIGINKLKGFKEGAEQSLIHEVENENFDLVFELIDLGEEFSDICVKCLVYSLFSINIKEKIDRKLYREDDFDKKFSELFTLEARKIVKEHLKKLFNDFTQEDIRVLEKINSSLGDFASKKSTLIRQVLFEELKEYSELHLTVLEFMIKGIGLNNWDNNKKLELLDNIEKKIDQLPKKEDVKFLSSIGSGYALINEFEKSERFQKKAYELVQDSDHKEKISICGRLGTLYSNWAGKNYRIELFDTSERYHNQAILSAISEFGEYSSEVAMHRNNLAVLLTKKNNALSFKLSDVEKASNISKAYELLELSRNSVERNSGAYSGEMAGNYHNLAFLFCKNDPSKALEMYLKSFEIVERIFSENDRNRETLMKNIGRLYEQLGNDKEAFNYFLKGSKIEFFHNKKADLLKLNLLYKLKDQLFKSGDYEALIEYCNHILKIKKDHRNAIETLGDCYYTLGDHHRAYDQFILVYEEVKSGDGLLKKLIETAVKIERISEALKYYLNGLRRLRDEEALIDSDEFKKSKNLASNPNRRTDPQLYQERIKTEYNDLRLSCLALAEKHNKLNELPDWILADSE